MATQAIPGTVWAQASTHGVVPYRDAAGISYLVLDRAGDRRVFLNACPHRRLPLDRAGQFFVAGDRELLVCPHHGARFQPLTGLCVAGPCVGKSLARVAVLEGTSEAPGPLMRHP